MWNTFGSQPQPTNNTFGAANNQPQPQPTTGFGFGQPSTTGFGTTPAFGASAQPAASTGFGTSTGFGFGGASTSGFGSQPSNTIFPSTTTNTFGASTTPSFGGFGSTGTSAFGSTAQPNTSAFGSTSNTSSAFGVNAQPSTATFGGSAFGANTANTQNTSTSAFGRTPFGTGTSSAFGTSQPSTSFGSGFGASQPSAFGSMAGSTFGSTTAPSTSAFGSSNVSTGAFGSQNTFPQSNTGTGNPSYQTTPEPNEGGLNTNGVFHSITAMMNYKNKSFEELRVEDYQKGKKHPASQGFGVSSGMGMTSTSTFPSTTQSAISGAPFGSAFGQPLSANASSVPGSTNTGIFGQNQQQPSTGGIFGSQPTQPQQPQPSLSSFGGLNTASTFKPSFGQPNVTSNTTLGSANPFGSLASPTPTLGQPQPQLGQQPQTSIFGSQQTQQQPSFGLGTQPNISTPQSALPQSAFGSTQPSFGLGTTSLTSQPTSIFGSTATKPLGTANATTANTMFTPSFNTSTFTAKPATNTFTPSVGFNNAATTSGLMSLGSNITPARLVTSIDKPLLDASPLFNPKISQEDKKPILNLDPSLVPKFTPKSAAKFKPRIKTPLSSNKIHLFDGKKTDEISSLSTDAFMTRSSIKSLDLSTFDFKRKTETDDISTPVRRLDFASNLTVSKENGSLNFLEPKNEIDPKFELNRTPSILKMTPGKNEKESAKEYDNVSFKRPSSPLYYMKPTVEELTKMSSRDLSHLPSLIVGRHGYGEVEFINPKVVRDEIYDIAGGIVRFSNKEITVYPDESKKPPSNHGLNVEAIVVLENCYPLEKNTKSPIKDANHPKMSKHLDKLKNMKDTEFISFNDGKWKFRVAHFSRYGLDDDDEEPAEVPVQPAKSFGIQADFESESEEADVVISEEYPIEEDMPDYEIQYEDSEGNPMETEDFEIHEISEEYIAEDEFPTQSINDVEKENQFVSPKMRPTSLLKNPSKLMTMHINLFQNQTVEQPKKRSFAEEDVESKDQIIEKVEEKYESISVPIYLKPMNFLSMPYSKKKSNVDLKADPSMFFHYSFRCGFSGNGLITQGNGSAIKIFKLDEVSEKIDEVAFKYFVKNSEMQETMTNRIPDFKSVARNSKLLDRILTFCACLFDTTEHNKNEYITMQERKNILSSWLKIEISSLVHSLNFESILHLILLNRVTEATLKSIDAKQPRLSTLISQLPGDALFRQKINEQLDVWNTQSVSEAIENYDVYLLLAARVEEFLTKRKNTLSKHFLLCFAIILWYGVPHESGIAEAVRVLRSLIRKGIIEEPNDILYEILLRFENAKHPMQSVLNGQSSQVQFYLSRLFKEESSQFHLEFVSDLLNSKNFWYWSIFPLMHFKTNNVISDIIIRNCDIEIYDETSTVPWFAFLTQDLAIPKQVIYDCQAIKAASMGQYERQFDFHYRAKNYEAAHQVFIEHLAEPIIFSNEVSKLENYLTVLKSEKINEWLDGGLIYSMYYTIMKSNSWSKKQLEDFFGLLSTKKGKTLQFMIGQVSLLCHDFLVENYVQLPPALPMHPEHKLLYMLSI